MPSLLSNDRHVRVRDLDILVGREHKDQHEREQRSVESDDGKPPFPNVAAIGGSEIVREFLHETALRLQRHRTKSKQMKGAVGAMNVKS